MTPKTDQKPEFNIRDTACTQEMLANSLEAAIDARIAAHVALEHTVNVPVEIRAEAAAAATRAIAAHLAEKHAVNPSETPNSSPTKDRAEEAFMNYKPLGGDEASLGVARYWFKRGYHAAVADQRFGNYD